MKFYHSARARGPWFEGWYLRHRAPDGQVFAVIPSLHTDRAGRKSAALQVITSEGAHTLTYPKDELLACTDFFQIWLGGNLFNGKGLWLDLSTPELELHGELRYGPFTPLKRDIMGPFRAGMECNHGVISMGHRLEGSLTINGHTVDFTGGVGYIESDWGRSFPRRYLWTQCAWREERANSLMLSVAEIPFPVRFIGCICPILYHGREYRLATYHGAKVLRWDAAGAEIVQGPYRLTVELLEAHPLPLQAPHQGALARTIHESLSATVRYRFWVDGVLLFDHQDTSAGFEYGH